MRESRTLGSVGAKAEWLSYPTNPPQHPRAITGGGATSLCSAGCVSQCFLRYGATVIWDGAPSKKRSRSEAAVLAASLLEAEIALQGTGQFA